MQEHRYTLSFFITFLVYILLISGYLYITHQRIITPKAPKIKVINLSLDAFTPPPTLHIPETADIPDPVEKPRLQQKEIPDIPSYAITTKPILKAKPPKPVKKRKKIVKNVIQKTSPPVTETVPKNLVSIKTKRFTPLERDKFLSQIRKKIEQAKSYPRIAKKRGIQGIVSLSFTITSSGKITNLMVKGPKVFHASAKNAVISAFPVDTTDAPLSFPLDISLKLHYQIH